ncbi:MAG: hypothetical protein ACRC28_01120 [Clostridium sp.]|uniref:hypothetical protein n=1 Tax=Clostridium sp. TaxID=1506 RepID=UPI003F3BC7D7
MKRMTIGIIVIIAIIFGLLFNLVIQGKKKSNDNNPKLNKICKDMSDVNASLNKISDIYMENLDKLKENKLITKKELAESIQIDYEKFDTYTASNEDAFTTSKEVIQILNIYYENSGIKENIKNKMKSIRVELEITKPTTEKEKKLYSEMINIFEKITEYNDLVFNFKGNLETYKNKVIFEKENIITLMKDVIDKH